VIRYPLAPVARPRARASLGFAAVNSGTTTNPPDSKKIVDPRIEAASGVVGWDGGDIICEWVERKVLIERGAFQPQP
jgi:hypothetical protein